MRARVIKIGNSHGLRIPKPILEQTGILDDVEIEVEKNQIIIRPIANPRSIRLPSESDHDVSAETCVHVSATMDSDVRSAKGGFRYRGLGHTLHPVKEGLIISHDRR